jgi:hypothetical protein
MDGGGSTDACAGSGDDDDARLGGMAHKVID